MRYLVTVLGGSIKSGISGIQHDMEGQKQSWEFFYDEQGWEFWDLTDYLSDIFLKLYQEAYPVLLMLIAVFANAYALCLIYRLQ